MSLSLRENRVDRFTYKCFKSSLIFSVEAKRPLPLDETGNDFLLQNTLAYSADLSETKRESSMRVVLTEKGSAKMIDWVLKKNISF